MFSFFIPDLWEPKAELKQEPKYQLKQEHADQLKPEPEGHLDLSKFQVPGGPGKL